MRIQWMLAALLVDAVRMGTRISMLICCNLLPPAVAVVDCFSPSLSLSLFFSLSLSLSLCLSVPLFLLRSSFFPFLDASGSVPCEVRAAAAATAAAGGAAAYSTNAWSPVHHDDL